MQSRSNNLPIVHLTDGCEGQRTVEDSAIKGHQRNARIGIYLGKQSSNRRNCASSTRDCPAGFRQRYDWKV
jgi:hypothetical protein